MGARESLMIDLKHVLRHMVTVDDACYAVLARHLGAPLVTGDLRLARTKQPDVPTLVPAAR